VVLGGAKPNETKYAGIITPLFWGEINYLHLSSQRITNKPGEN